MPIEVWVKLLIFSIHELQRLHCNFIPHFMMDGMKPMLGLKLNQVSKPVLLIAQ